MWWASANTSSPISVKVSLRVERWINRAPSSSSSLASCRDTTDLPIPSVAAALLMLPACTIALKRVNRCGFIGITSINSCLIGNNVMPN